MHWGDVRGWLSEGGTLSKCPRHLNAPSTLFSSTASDVFWLHDRSQVHVLISVVVGTARCAAFRERQGRLKAAKNLVSRGRDIPKPFLSLQVQTQKQSEGLGF